MHRFILHNDDVREASEMVASPGQVGLLAGWGVFSTLRVTNSVLFAYERHFARMQRDAKLLRIPFPSDPDYIKSRLRKLIAANGISDATLRVVVVRNKGGIWQGPGIERDFDLFALTTGLTNWGDGVKLSVAPQARHAASAYAGTKVTSWGMNLNWYEEAHERGYDEVVLLNERDEVSECTSANIFVVLGDRVITPPLSAGCLPGVTRDLLLNEIKVPGIQVSENTLLLPDLEAADEVFITSTTRDVLPVVAIEGLQIRRQGDIGRRLNRAFTDYIHKYTLAHASI
jgi:branched-chain amino acid aminotransferase